MELLDDTELLRRYAEENAEGEFAELVRRRVGFVYTGALRRVGGDTHLAEDVTQQVFAALARGAGELVRHPALSAWLFAATRNLAAHVVRGERRRRVREQEAQTMMTNDSAGTTGADGAAVAWERLRPVLDEALDELEERDREAVLLRFSEGKSFAEVGARLRLAENAARMRVDRALDKLHAALARRGVTSTAAALGVALGNQALASAPVGLAATVTGAALAGVGAAVTGASAGAGSAMVFMGTIKLQWGITAALVVAGTTGWVTQSRVDAALRGEIAAMRQQQMTPAAFAELQAENRRLAGVAAEVEAWRKDDAELARLRDEVAAVKARQQQAARAEADARAKRAAEIAAMPVYAETQVDVQPEPKFQGGITVPNSVREAVRASSQNAEAKVSYVVNVDGEVGDVILISATHPDWAAAVIAGVKQWQFAPAQKDGAAVNVRRELPFVFTNEVRDGTKKGNGRAFWF